MNRPTGPTLPRIVQMPLRDAFRGMATFAEATEEALEPLASALPQPVRSRLGRALRRIEGMGSDLLGSHVAHDDVLRAAAFIQGQANERRDAETCATVLAFAWDKVQHAEGLHPLLSETLASIGLSRLDEAKTVTPGDHAEAVLRVLRDTRVAGGLPGVPAGPQETDRAEVDLRLFAIATWLLAARAGSMEDEIQLLDMALALTRAYEADVLAAFSDRASLATLLQSLSDHL